MSTPRDVRLPERTHHLEAMLQYTLAARTLSAHNETERASYLHELAAQVIHAEQVMVLLANPRFDALQPVLGIPAVTEWLEVTAAHLKSLSMGERQQYLGDEVLLIGQPAGITAQECETLEAQSYMRLPLILNDQPKGCVIFANADANIFDGETLQFARFYADLISTLVENSLLREHYDRTKAYQQAVYKMSLLINDELSLAEVLNQIAQQAITLTSGTSAMIMLSDKNEALEAVVTTGSPRMLDLHQYVRVGEGLIGQVALQKRTILVEDYSQYPFALPDLAEKGLLGSVIGVPLMLSGELLGVIGVACRRDDLLLAESDQEVLEMLAPLAATAIEKAQLRDTVRQERTQLHALLDHIRAPILVINRGGILEMANPEAHLVGKRLNISLYSLLGRHIRQIFRDLMKDERTQEIVLPDQFQVGVPMDIDFGLAGEFVLRIAEVPDLNGEVGQYVVVGQEVTRERRLDRAKSHLLHVLSHDLGNIMTLGLGYAGLAVEEDLSPADYKLSMQKIYEALIRARSLVRDVVALDEDYDSSADGRINRPYDLAETLQEVDRVHQEFAEQKQQQLMYTADAQLPEMSGNPAMIKQALENLVMNAIKYTPEKGVIKVHLTMQEQYAVVTIADSGLGIPADALPHIWDRYYRVEEHKRLHIPGTGLGLPLVKSVIKAHQGKIEVESEVGIGTTFRVYLPLPSEG